MFRNACVEANAWWFMTNSCLTTAIYASICIVIICLVAMVDIILRDIPPIIAKARVSLATLLALNLTVDLLILERADHRIVGFFTIQLAAAMSIASLYTSESLIQVCLNSFKAKGGGGSSRESARLKHVRFFITTHPWIRGFALVYSIALGIVFLFSSTNAVMIGYHVAFAMAFAWPVLSSVAACVIAQIIRRHMKFQVRFTLHMVQFVL